MIYIKKIVLLFGGASEEHDVSISSFTSIYESIDNSLFSVDCIYISKENIWYKYTYNTPLSDLTKEDIIHNIIYTLKQYDCVFPILHGKNGEDGTLQGMLELFNIPFVGCNHKASTIGLDKHLSKIIFENLNIPQLPYLIINQKTNIKNIIKNITYPVIIKPNNGGSSIGINIANNKKELITAINTAFKFDTKVIIEKFIKARELEVAVLEKNKLHISTIGEITHTSAFYDFDTKYKNDNYTIIIPSKIPKPITKNIITYTNIIFNTLECKDISRIDFLYNEENNQVYINEINTFPGFTKTSMYPKLLVHDKINYTTIITQLILNNIKN